MKNNRTNARGVAGSKALKLSAQNKVKENKRKLAVALRKFKNEKIPLVKTELASECGLSIATLNRSPYKEMIREHLSEEKVLLSPNGRQEIARLRKKVEELTEKNKELEEKYRRLKKEINYSKELFM